MHETSPESVDSPSIDRALLMEFVRFFASFGLLTAGAIGALTVVAALMAEFAI